jgi:hypothetical protein
LTISIPSILAAALLAGVVGELWFQSRMRRAARLNVEGQCGRCGSRSGVIPRRLPLDWAVSVNVCDACHRKVRRNYVSFALFVALLIVLIGALQAGLLAA